MAKFKLNLQTFSQASDSYGYHMTRLTLIDRYGSERRSRGMRWLKWDVLPLGDKAVKTPGIDV